MDHVAVAKWFTYLEDKRTDKFFALKRFIVLTMVIPCDIGTSCHTFVFTFFNPTRKLTRIEAQQKESCKSPPKSSKGLYLSSNQIFYTEECLEIIETFFKLDSIIITVLRLPLLQEHKQLYCKSNDAAGGEEQHLLQLCLNLKAKLVIPAQCLRLWGPKLSICFKKLEQSH